LQEIKNAPGSGLVAQLFTSEDLSLWNTTLCRFLNDSQISKEHVVSKGQETSIGLKATQLETPLLYFHTLKVRQLKPRDTVWPSRDGHCSLLLSRPALQDTTPQL
jgi:hypothetical protein